MVEACVSAYAQTVAQCPGDHWRRLANGGRERVTTSALSRISRRPRGIGWKLIKGASFIRESIAVCGVGGSTWAHIVGITCIEAEHAEATFDAIGDID